MNPWLEGRATLVVRAITVVALCCAAPAWAQGSAVITGTVIDASTKKPIVDCVVTATSPNLQGEQMVVTDATGLYRIPQLPPGAYSLRFERDTFKVHSRGDIQLGSDRMVRVNIELLPDTLQSEEIVLVTRAPTIDIGSSSTGVSVGQEFVRSIPLVTPGSKNSASRSFEALAAVAPGAHADTYGVSMSGATSPENQYVVDGIPVNDPAYGILGTALPIDFVQEANAISGGYLPEYGRATGGVLNVITKTGSNEFHGSVFGNWTPGSLEGRQKPVQRAGTVLQTQERLWNNGDFGFDLGGPVLKDKLWFFVGAAPSFERRVLDRSKHRLLYQEDGTALRNENGLQLAEKIEGTDERFFADQTALSYIGKLTYLLSADHRVTFSASGSPTRSGGPGEYGIDPTDGQVEVANTAGEIGALAHRYKNDSRDLSVQWSSAFFNKRFLIDSDIGWHHQETGTAAMDGSTVGSPTGLASVPRLNLRRTKPHSILEVESLPDPAVCAEADAANAKNCPITTYALGGPGQLSEALLDRQYASFKLTYLFVGLGHHEMKTGLDVDRTQYDNTKGYSGGTMLSEARNGNYFTDLRQYGYVTGPDLTTQQTTVRAVTNSTAIGSYVQDSWHVADLVTLNLGARWDQQQIFGADGALAMSLNNMFSPRVGFIYDFTQAGRSKIFANFARYFEGAPLDIADRQFPGERSYTQAWTREGGQAGADRYGTPVDAPGCDPLADPAHSQLRHACRDPRNRIVLSKVGLGESTDPSQYTTATGGDRSPIDPGLRPQSLDEFVAGGEYAVIPDGRAGVTYTRRRMNDVIEDMSRDEASTYFIGNPGRGIAADFPRAVRDYDAVTVHFFKNFTDLWQAQVSYTWAKLRGNYAGLFRPETGQLDPNINSDFDLISLLDNRLGPLPGDRTHTFKVLAGKDFVVSGSQSFNLGVGYQGQSGTPLNYFAAHPLYGVDEVFVLPRGSGGRTPWVHNIDTRLGYTFRFARSSAVTFTVDVFNLFNWQEVTRVDQRLSNSEIRPYKHTDPATSPQEALCLAGSDPNCQTKLVGFESGEPIQPDEINPNFKNPTVYQVPREVRFGAKVTF